MLLCGGTGTQRIQIKAVIAFPYGPKKVAGLPAADTDKVVAAISQYLDCSAAKNVFETALNAPNLVAYLAGSVLNTYAIDRNPDFAFYRDGLSEHVIDMQVAVEKESVIIDLAERLGLEMSVMKALVLPASVINKRDFHAEGLKLDDLGMAGLNTPKEINEYLYTGANRGSDRQRAEDKDRRKNMTAFHSEGFLEVHSDSTVVLLQACEWPWEVGVNRAGEARERAEHRLEQHKELQAIARSKITFSRALTRIRVKTSSSEK